LRLQQTSARVRFGLLLLSLALCGCGPARAFAAANRPTSQFLSSPLDPRVFYEPGAEAMARTVAAAMPTAVATVEAWMPGSFAVPVRIYVCATIGCMTSYGADPRAGGLTSNHRVFISPKPENTTDRVPRVLTHELSHLHLSQKRGLVSFSALPVWFVEGLAVDVSGGAGAEGVSENDARLAIRDGHAFMPDVGGALGHRDGASANGLAEHMFYKQAGMFVASMRSMDDGKFRALLARVEDGDSVERALHEAYGINLEAAWQRFTADAPP
jgi:hypothetical protein